MGTEPVLTPIGTYKVDILYASATNNKKDEFITLAKSVNKQGKEEIHAYPSKDDGTITDHYMNVEKYVSADGSGKATKIDMDASAKAGKLVYALPSDRISINKNGITTTVDGKTTTKPLLTDPKQQKVQRQQAIDGFAASHGLTVDHSGDKGPGLLKRTTGFIKDKLGKSDWDEGSATPSQTVKNGANIKYKDINHDGRNDVIQSDFAGQTRTEPKGLRHKSEITGVTISQTAKIAKYVKPAEPEPTPAAKDKGKSTSTSPQDGKTKSHTPTNTGSGDKAKKKDN